MTGFHMGAAVLLCIAGALLFWPRRREPRAADAQDPNVRWFRQRSAEIGDNETLLEDAKLRLLEDADDKANSDESERSGAPLLKSQMPVVVFLCVVLLSAAIYVSTGSVEDVLIYQDLSSLSPEATDEQRDALRQRIERRSEQRPENLQYLSLLGQLYMASEDYASASETFGMLAAQAPEDPQALALAAQAQFLAGGRALDAESQLLAEKALAIDPAQRTALGLLGMASFEKESYLAAARYWERLQDLESPGSPAFEMLENVLNLARERAGLAVSGAAQSSGFERGTADAAALNGIRIMLAMDEGQIAENDATLFVFARPAGQDGGMPIAVRRLSAASLPLDIVLTDGDSMAGQLLSNAGEVRITAQLSPSGQPSAANASHMAVSEPVLASSETQVTVNLRLKPL
ncbi:MAG: c-type cytochrome biogenesis protein CcmI [Pseudomonadota bacterium]